MESYVILKIVWNGDNANLSLHGTFIVRERAIEIAHRMSKMDYGVGPYESKIKDDSEHVWTLEVSRKATWASAAETRIARYFVLLSPLFGSPLEMLAEQAE